MSKSAGTVAAIGLLGLVSWASAAENYSETETHVMRGISERQNTMNRFSALAMEQGASELVKNFAKRDSEEHARLNEEIRLLALRIGIAGVGMGAGPPPGAAPGAGPGGPPGAGPGGPPGAPPGGARGGGAGPNVYASRYQEQLKGLSGAAFDEMYLLRVLQYHEDLERTINGEIREGVNPELIAWSRANIKTYEQHAQLVQRILYGEVQAVPATGPLMSPPPAGGARPPAGVAPPQR